MNGMSESFEQRIVELRTQLFTICYGEDDANRLMAERLVERSKLRAAINVEGKSPEQTQREVLYWDDFDTLDEATQCREHIEKHIREHADITRMLERELAASGSDRHVSVIARSNEKIQEYSALLPEAKALEHEITNNLSDYETRHGKPEPRMVDGIMPPAPRMLDLGTIDFHLFQAQIDGGLHLLYENLLGRKQAAEVVGLTEQERLRAVDAFDVASIASSTKAMQQHLVTCREIAVQLITTKNRLTMMLAHVQSIVEDIPEETEDAGMVAKAAKGKSMLQELEPLHAKSYRLVEEMKQAVHILEQKARDEVAKRAATGAHR